MNEKSVLIVTASSGMLKHCLPNVSVWINNSGKQSVSVPSVLFSITEYILSFLCAGGMPELY